MESEMSDLEQKARETGHPFFYLAGYAHAMSRFATLLGEGLDADTAFRQCQDEMIAVSHALMKTEPITGVTFQ